MINNNKLYLAYHTHYFNQQTLKTFEVFKVLNYYRTQQQMFGIKSNLKR